MTGTTCWYCEGALIWGGDESEDDNEDFDMVTNLTCQDCGSFVLYYKKRETDAEG